MNQQIKQLKRENQDLKDLLQDVHLMVIGKDVKNFGLMEQEIAAKVSAVAGGKKYNALDWCFKDVNGDQ
jgi:hypothetical protein